MVVCKEWNRIIGDDVAVVRSNERMKAAREFCGVTFYRKLPQIRTFEVILTGDYYDEETKAKCRRLITLGGGDPSPVSWTRRRAWCFLKGNFKEIFSSRIS